MKWDPKRGCFRATAGDAHYGPSCPRCCDLKDDQALYCRACHMELRTTRDYVCECAESKHPTAKRCIRCAARERAKDQPRDAEGHFLPRKRVILMGLDGRDRRAATTSARTTVASPLAVAVS